MTRFHNPQLANQWRERIEQFERSDLTIAQFCKREGCSDASFYHWRRRFRDTQHSTATAFVEVDLPTDLPHRDRPESIEVNLPGGARIDIPAGTSPVDCCNLIQAVVQATARQTDAPADEVLS